MTTEIKESLKNDLMVLAIEMTPEAELKDAYKGLAKALRKEIVADILEKNYFEVTADGKFYATPPPEKADGSDLQNFLKKNKISVMKPQRKTLTQLIEDQKTSTWKNIFK